MIPFPSPAAGHRPQLDSLRALAVVAVLFGHFWHELPRFGHEGVRLFFVLSGFLITSILLDLRASLDAAGAAADRAGVLRRFCARRALRIFPAYYLLLAVLAVAGDAAIRRDLWIDALHLHNLLLAWRGSWTPYATSHLWSLSLEEQFYLVWPLVVLFAPRPAIGAAIGACIVGAPLFRAAALAGGVDSGVAVWVLPPSSLDALGFGALLAALRASPLRRRLLCGAGACAAAVAVPALLGQRLGLLGIPFALEFVVLEWALALAFVALVARAADGFGGAAGALLSLAPLRYVGRISYGIYLYHLPVFFVFERALQRFVVVEPMPGPLRMAVGTLLTLAVAALSWHCLEAPLNRLKRRLPYGAGDAATQPAQPAARPARSG